MKRLLSLLHSVALLLIGCAGAKTVVVTPPPPPPANADFTLDWAWTQNVANAPFCSGTVSTSCVKSFTWGYSVGSVASVVKTTSLPYSACPATIPSPPDISCEQPATALGVVQFYDTANALLPLGGTGSTPYVLTNWLDMNGASQQTPPATAPNLIEPAAGATLTSASAH